VEQGKVGRSCAGEREVERVSMLLRLLSDILSRICDL